MIKADFYIIILIVKMLSLFILLRRDKTPKAAEWPGYNLIKKNSNIEALSYNKAYNAAYKHQC